MVNTFFKCKDFIQRKGQANCDFYLSVDDWHQSGLLLEVLDICYNFNIEIQAKDFLLSDFMFNFRLMLHNLDEKHDHNIFASEIKDKIVFKCDRVVESLIAKLGLILDTRYKSFVS